MSRKKTISKPSFAFGVVDKDFLSKYNLEFFPSCAKTLENCTISSAGPVKRRAGQQYISTMTNGVNLGLKMEAFFVDETTSYLLVFSDGKFDVYKDDVFQVSFSSAPISSLTASHITTMNALQVEDALILVHEDVQPIEIKCTNATTWTATSITFENIPYKAFGSTSTTSPNASLTPETYLSGRGVKFTASSGVFSSSHVGQKLIFTDRGEARIKRYLSSTQVLADLKTTLPSTDAIASGQWKIETGYEQIMSATKGWPSCLAFGYGRLFFAGFKHAKQVLLGSSLLSSGFYNFDMGIAGPADGINLDATTSPIKNILMGEALFVFTRNEVMAIPSTFNNTTASIKQCSEIGISSCNPVEVFGSTSYVEMTGGGIRRLRWDYRVDNYKSLPVTLYSSEHLSTPTRMVLAPSTTDRPHQLLYVLNTTGTLSVANIFSDGQVDQFSWSTFTTTGTYQDVCIVGDDVYFLVQRTINASQVMFLEKSNANFKLDGAKSVTVSTATTSFTGFDHLEGQSSSVIGDNYVLTQATPASGAVTISRASLQAELGFSFFAKIEPPQILSDNQGFSHEFKRKVVSSIYLSLKETPNLVVMFNNKTNRYSPVTLGGSSASSAYLDNHKRCFIGGLAKDDGVITITQDEPHPLEVASIEVEFR